MDVNGNFYWLLLIWASVVSRVRYIEIQLYWLRGQDVIPAHGKFLLASIFWEL